MTHGKVRPASVLRAARKPSRRPSHSGTKRSLLDNAQELFARHGYSGTSLDEVVAAARVTKGALYHHFPSKLALFESVFERLQDSSARQIEQQIDQVDDPWERARTGLRAFLQVCQEPHFRRICLQEAPAALGHERFAEAERTASLGLVERIVDDLLADLGGADGLGETFAVIFYGAIRSASEYVSDAEDPDLAAAQIEEVIGAILAGLRSLESLVAPAS